MSDKLLPCPWCGGAVDDVVTQGSTFRWRVVQGCCTDGPEARFDWTERKLKDVARWANGHVWRKAPFSEYDRHMRAVAPAEVYDNQQGLFV